MDADGLPSSFTYQWVRVDSDGTSNEMDIGSNSDTYTLMADDVGKKVKVKVSFTDNGGTTETVTSDAYPSSGTIATAGICDRTPAVRDELVSLISGVDDCVGVTATHLANITSIDLSSQSIADLKAGDFAGLTALMELNLAGNSLTSLPAGVFDGLTSLTSLSLDDNGLESLHDDVFADLTSLTLLTLNDNALNMLPNDVFKPLTELTDAEAAGQFGGALQAHRGCPARRRNDLRRGGHGDARRQRQRRGVGHECDLLLGADPYHEWGDV